jgi:hypothetical protein
MCPAGRVVFRSDDRRAARVDLAVIGEMEVLRAESPLGAVSAACLVVAGDGEVSAGRIRAVGHGERLMHARFIPGCLLPCRAEWVHDDAPATADVPLVTPKLMRVRESALARRACPAWHGGGR